MTEERILTCVFCGEAYPAGTEPHSEQILIDHIEICPKHPLMKARKRADDFEKAFIVMENSFKEASKKIADLWDALDQIKTVTEKVQKKYF